MSLPLHGKRVDFPRLDGILECTLLYQPRLEGLLGKIDNLARFIASLNQMIQQAVTSRCQELSETKFNIYSMENYHEIRQELAEAVRRLTARKDCANLMPPQQALAPYLEFFESRPLSATNKSLLIFKLNISRVLFTELEGKSLVLEPRDGQDYVAYLRGIFEQCVAMLAEAGLQAIRQKYLADSDPRRQLLGLLELSTLPEARAMLSNERALYLHLPDYASVRNRLFDLLKPIYDQAILALFPEGSPTTQAVLQLCEKHRVSRVRFGKFADQLKISPLEDILQ
jgi:hypothetical protein